LGLGCSGTACGGETSGSDGGKAGGNASAGAGKGSGRGAEGGTITTDPVFGPAPCPVSSAGASLAGEAEELGEGGVAGFFPAAVAAEAVAAGAGGFGLAFGMGAWVTSALMDGGSARAT